MAMIGRNAAVAEVGKHRHQVEGPFAFAAWLGVHAMLLSGVHSKTDAFLEWAWDYFDRDHAATVEASQTPERLAWADHGEDVPHIVLDRPTPGPPAQPPPEEAVMADEYDVIIVGSGAGGGTLAHRLAPSGKRVLILERGDWLPREVENWDATAVFVDNRYISPDTWYDKDGKAFQPQVHYFVGGATKFYGAALYRLREQGLRRAEAPRRDLARVADRLRRPRAVLHPGREAVPGARRPRRGPDRAAGRRRTRSRRCRTSRASSSSSTTWRRSGCTRSTPPTASCSTRPNPPSAPASAARPVTGSPAWCTPSPTRT